MQRVKPEPNRQKRLRRPPFSFGQIESHLDAGQIAYAEAAKRDDQVAKRFYLAHEAPGARKSLRGGLALSRLDRLYSTSGWIAVIRNYGASEAWRGTVSMVVWTLFLVLTLIFGIKAYFLPKPIADEGNSSRRAASAGQNTGTRGQVRGKEGGQSARPKPW